MDLLWFLLGQFKIPLIGITAFGLFIWIRFFVLPVRKQNPPGYINPLDGPPEEKRDTDA